MSLRPRTTRRNTRLFALRSTPPGQIILAGHSYRLVKVFKHDFFAATCLYRTAEPAEYPRIVVKYGREQDFLGLPTDGLGMWNRRREENIYRRLSGVEGTPAWIGRVGHTGYAIEYLDAVPLDHLDSPPQGFFDRLRELFDAVHARGVGYCDANKRSNILVGSAGEPYLVDFQLSVRRRERLPWPWRQLADRVVDYVIDRDIYHLYKHKRRLAPQELTPEEEAISRRRSGLHLLHRRLTKPWRSLRRAFLRRQHRQGLLESPTAHLEDHHQPEKATWRDENSPGDQ
ncbi:MAG: hypothetical protein ACLFV7_05975 [Phycisphaerae bacterium]